MPSFFAMRNVDTLIPLSARERKKTQQKDAKNGACPEEIWRETATRRICDIAANASSPYAASEITANAPMCGSFRISSFFSRSCHECTASIVSIKPSIWMPPVTRSGIASETAVAVVFPIPAARHTRSQTHSRSPITAPTIGKKMR